MPRKFFTKSFFNRVQQTSFFEAKVQHGANHDLAVAVAASMLEEQKFVI
jgi:CRISPR/Cas system-associated endoribonuclease Cas2